MYQARFIIDDHYIIGNEEYGYDLLDLNILQNLKERLTEEEIKELIKHIEKNVNDMLNGIGLPY